METKFVKLDHQTLAYRESSGTGAEVLFVHGNSCSSESFKHQLEGELGEKYHFLAVDLPGHGQSDPAPNFKDYSMIGYARVLNEAMAKLGMDNPVLVGWSLGGHIVLEMEALQMPVLEKAAPESQVSDPNANQTNIQGAIQGVMIFGTPPLAFPPDMENAFLPAPEMSMAMQGELTEDEARLYAAVFFKDKSEDLAEMATRLVLKTDPNARLGLGENLGPDTYHDEIEVVKNMEIPLAVLHGESEKLANLDYISELQMPSLWRNQVQLIKDSGHAPQLENSKAFNHLLSEFMESIQR